MDWKVKVELFEQLRREHEFGIGTVAGVAAKFGVHRRLIGYHAWKPPFPGRIVQQSRRPGAFGTVPASVETFQAALPALSR